MNAAEEIYIVKIVAHMPSFSAMTALSADGATTGRAIPAYPWAVNWTIPKDVIQGLQSNAHRRACRDKVAMRWQGVAANVFRTANPIASGNIPGGPTTGLENSKNVVRTDAVEVAAVDVPAASASEACAVPVAEARIYCVVTQQLGPWATPAPEYVAVPTTADCSVNCPVVRAFARIAPIPW